MTRTRRHPLPELDPLARSTHQKRIMVDHGSFGTIRTLSSPLSPSNRSGIAPRTVLRNVFPAKALRDQAVEVPERSEGGRQTLGRLA